MKKLLILLIFLVFPSLFLFSQHASLLDALNQGAQTATQALNTISRQTREDNDRILFWIDNDLKMESSRFLISLYSRTDFNIFFPLWYARRDSLFYVHLDRINNNYSLDGLNYIYSQNDVFVTREINKIVLQKWEELGMQEDIKIFSYRPLPTVQNRSSGNRSSASGNGRENTDWVLPVVIMTMVGIIIGGSVVLSL